MRSTWLVAACLIAGANAAMMQPTRLPCARSVAPRAAAPNMLVPPPALDVAATSFTATALPATLLLGDAFDALQGVSGSPVILLLPIGAGSLVAAAIIYILVKAAG